MDQQDFHIYITSVSKRLFSLGQTHPFFTEQAQNHIANGDGVVIVPHDANYERTFRESVGFSDEKKFEMTFIIPLSSQFVLTISSKSQPLDSGLPEELSLLGSIVNLYLNLVDQELWNQSKSKKRRSISPGQALTERQGLILKLMRDGQRNHEIAKVLGYSESLIRQETMAIYKKLGVPGRKSLTSAPDDHMGSK